MHISIFLHLPYFYYMQVKYRTMSWNTVPVSQFILPPWTACPPGGQAVPGYLTPRPGYLNPRGASCPGRFILPPAHIKKILLCDVYYYLQHYNNYMQFLSYNYVNLNDYFKHSDGFLIDKGWGGGGKLSRAVYLAPHLEFQREWIICKFYYTIYYRNIC